MQLASVGDIMEGFRPSRGLLCLPVGPVRDLQGWSIKPMHPWLEWAEEWAKRMHSHPSTACIAHITKMHQLEETHASSLLQLRML